MPSTDVRTDATRSFVRADDRRFRRLRAGVTTSVETDESVDPDLYFALGKFDLKGTYQYSVQRPWLGTPYIKVERVYDGTETYTWDPPRQCGIIDHIVPCTLAQRGQAADFRVRIRWGEPEFKVNL